MRTLSFAVMLVTGLFAVPAWACGGGCGQAAAKAGCGGGCGGAKTGCGGGGGGCGCGGQKAARNRVDRGTHALPSSIAWRSLEEGRQEAARTRRPILVFFSFGKLDPYSKDLNQVLFGDANVQATLNGDTAAIPVRIPLWAMTPAERALGEKLGYQEDALLALMNADGKVARTRGGQPMQTTGVPDPAALLATIGPLVN